MRIFNEYQLVATRTSAGSVEPVALATKLSTSLERNPRTEEKRLD